MLQKRERALNSNYTKQYVDKKGQDLLKSQYSKPLLADIFWMNAAVILPGHAALKKGKEHDQEKAAFLAVANNLAWKLTENEGKRGTVGKEETGNINIFAI